MKQAQASSLRALDEDGLSTRITQLKQLGRVSNIRRKLRNIFSKSNSSSNSAAYDTTSESRTYPSSGRSDQGLQACLPHNVIVLDDKRRGSMVRRSADTPHSAIPEVTCSDL